MRSPEQLIKEGLLDKMPPRPTDALHYLLEQFDKEVAVLPGSGDPQARFRDSYQQLIAWAMMFRTFVKKHFLNKGIDAGNASISGISDNDVAGLFQEIQNYKSQAEHVRRTQNVGEQMRSFEEFFSRTFDDIPSATQYTKDRSNLQAAIDLVRQQIQETYPKKWDQPKRQRLSARLNDLQKEFDKEISDYDRICGIAFQLVVAGRKTKPLFDATLQLLYGVSLVGFAFHGLEAPPPPSSWLLPAPQTTEPEGGRE